MFIRVFIFTPPPEVVVWGRTVPLRFGSFPVFISVFIFTPPRSGVHRIHRVAQKPGSLTVFLLFDDFSRFRVRLLGGVNIECMIS